ncbi:lipopolysaccharide biosynthesis protein [Marinobacter nanhaiticus D15-8W]|uniref:Lipopolysaccharide biosynthesis protein n=1 Tax=Marinobacter nanhaiticus D15-8W TaxID=626887 RepID=N6VX26_9GAMM|nr:lipopolysaccharide biosynthesis protein [Marinobacter nanhaiticus]ENO14785.1 lipopolysaccharide biosynthesis protein [Marinobacter nanhaiticus D15-8W]
MDLKKRLGYSTIWMSIGATGTSITSFVVFVVISRLLTPAEIGLVAFTLILVDIGKLIANAGLGKAIVQDPECGETFASTCFYLNLIFATLTAALFYFIGVPLVEAFYDPAAGPILQVLCLLLFLEGVKAVHEGKLKRSFAFRIIAARTVFSSLISGVVGVYMAFAGYGVWALVAQQVVNLGLVSLTTIWMARWRPSLTFSAGHARKLMRFSSPLLAAQLMGTVSSKVYELLVGILIGPAALGLFKVGGRALYILQDIVLKPFEHTLLSALSRLPDTPTMAHATMRVIRMSAYMTFPIFFGAAAIAPDFIVLVFGQKWETSGQLMTILALGIPPMVVGFHIKDALTAKGHSRQVMNLAGVMLAINGVLGLSTVPLGLTAAAVGFSARNYIVLVFYLRLFRRMMGQSPMGVLKAVGPAFTASIMMMLLVMGVGMAVPGDVPTYFSVPMMCLAGIVFYLLLMATAFKQETSNFLDEGADMLPAKVKPVAQVLQRLLGTT